MPVSGKMAQSIKCPLWKHCEQEYIPPTCGALTLESQYWEWGWSRDRIIPGTHWIGSLANSKLWVQ